MNIETVLQRFRSAQSFEREISEEMFYSNLEVCMETSCLCTSEGHKYGGRKLTKAYVTKLTVKSL